MNVALREGWTVERFLAWEDQQEGRHEFDGARIIEMTGGSRAHQRLVTNLVRLLEDRLDLDRFDAVPEMRVAIGDRIRYPDVSVVAGRVADSVRTLQDAVVLFEVVSPDSRDVDRGDKLQDYAEVPGVRRYVILEQSRMEATVLVRTAAGWAEEAAGDAVGLPEVGVVLPLAAIYRGVRFD